MASPTSRTAERRCGVHINTSVIGEDVLLNLEQLGSDIKPGDLMSITVAKPDPESRTAAAHFGSRHASARRTFSSSDDPSHTQQDRSSARRYIFVVKEMSKDQIVRHSGVEIWLAKHIGDAFGIKTGTQVLLAPVDEESPAIEASHVELSFKDMYLSRADMWRLTVANLTDKTVYKGQVIWFLGTIKVTVMTVFVSGRKVHSAFFGKNTRPIFRSESARYVLFVQMASEMWDFDSDNSGEIMFEKVVNGFLPALFKKWAMLQVKHLVTIVLFARVEYNTGLTNELMHSTQLHDFYTGYQTTGNKRPYKDFYHVVVNEMSSGAWSTILHNLKKEFNVFRKDINLHHIEVLNEMARANPDETDRPIKAESTLAMHGNFLEAINLASSQFAHDYIDRDLLRTGILIVVISPGSGVFEVEYETLRRTTEALVGNGIGIDLICIPKVPLHSVPLFRYRNPQFVEPHQRPPARLIRSRDSTPRQDASLVGSYTTLPGSFSPTKMLDGAGRNNQLVRLVTEEWAFALPQWLHVSYWTGRAEDALTFHGITLSATDSSKAETRDDFMVRCRLYELQMRSVLETNEIETAPLHTDPKYPLRATGTDSSGIVGLQKPPVSLFDPVIGLQKFNPDKNGKNGDTSIWKRLQAFDESRIRLPPKRSNANMSTSAKITRELDEATRKQLTEDTRLFGSSIGDGKSKALASFSSSLASIPAGDSLTIPDILRGASRRGSTTANSQRPTISKTPRLLRQISLGHKGFGIAAPKVATAQVKVEHVNAMNVDQRSPTPSKISPSIVNSPRLKSTSPQLTPSASTSRSLDQSASELADQLQDLVQPTPSKPIFIKGTEPNPDSFDQQSSQSQSSGALRTTAMTPFTRNKRDVDDVKSSNQLRADDAKKLYNSKLLAGALPELPSTLSPTTAMAPWLVVLNPSNPDVNKVDDAILYSRWQHVFPRPTEMKVMKWKSLSSPAAVPLTTEYFPTKAQFDSEYTRQPYTIAQNLDDEFSEEPKSRGEFLRELINARFSHGFQVVIGPAVAKALGQRMVKIADIFLREPKVDDGTSLFMGIGNTIHQLSCVNGTEVEVNIFVRKRTESLPSAVRISPSIYRPAIRTYLETRYKSREVDILTPNPDKNWNNIDSYLAGHTDELSENLRYWRARFVLIPVSIPRNSSNRSQNGDDEEETRLEGIKRLTQIWQKARVLPSDERNFQSSGRRRIVDPNPLDIVYKTDDPSVVVTGEADEIPFYENAEAMYKRGQLFSGRERFSKSSFNINALVEAIQQPAENGGIRMQNRRWHLRLHYNCFIGSDMTTWLLDNFDDLESREEAVELGNSLMALGDDRNRDKDKEPSKDTRRDRDRGIFVHVERRHTFRDGQYFYQIATEYAKPQPPGWLGIRRKEPSVPQTPLNDSMLRDSPRNVVGVLSRPSSIYDDGCPMSGATTPNAALLSGKRPKVALTKMMTYDVDHRKKSYRPERVNLHYDRLHNPDNCYHIRIDWMNVTAKLVDEAVRMWAAVVAPFGLQLVKVPIAEASRITEVTPFRKPYPIRIVLPPPSKRPVTYYDSNSFTPQSQPGKHFYQKALLKKFDFVLDFESASSFPPGVDVSYSWGKPDYTCTQYLHRSGVLLVQITEDGNYAALANKHFYNYRPMAAKADPHPAADRGPPPFKTSVNTNPYLIDPSPLQSPMIRPALFPQESRASLHPYPTNSPAGLGTTSSSFLAESNAALFNNGIVPELRACDPLHKRFGGAAAAASSSAHHAHHQPTPFNPVGEPERIMGELEAFCQDEEALETFYRETLERAASTAAPTPAISALSVGGRDGGRALGSAETSSLSDLGIPVLGLPPSVLEATGVGASASVGGAGVGSAGLLGGSAGSPGPRVGTPSAALTNPMLLRRGSMQYI